MSGDHDYGGDDFEGMSRRIHEAMRRIDDARGRKETMRLAHEQIEAKVRRAHRGAEVAVRRAMDRFEQMRIEHEEAMTAAAEWEANLKRRPRRRPGGSEPLPVEPSPKPNPRVGGAEAPLD